MGAWHKALKNVNEYVERHVNVECQCGDDYSIDVPLETPPTSSNRRKWTTKTEMVGWIKNVGWTWDEHGNWLCPACIKTRGGEE